MNARNLCVFSSDGVFGRHRVTNVLAAGGCELETRGKKYQLFVPEVVRDPTRRRFPFPVRTVLKVVGADEYMERVQKNATSGAPAVLLPLARSKPGRPTVNTNPERPRVS
jgi:hypothetical protein